MRSFIAENGERLRLSAPIRVLRINFFGQEVTPLTPPKSEGAPVRLCLTVTSRNNNIYTGEF